MDEYYHITLHITTEQFKKTKEVLNRIHSLEGMTIDLDGCNIDDVKFEDQRIIGKIIALMFLTVQNYKPI